MMENTLTVKKSSFSRCLTCFAFFRSGEDRFWALAVMPGLVSWDSDALLPAVLGLIGDSPYFQMRLRVCVCNTVMLYSAAVTVV